MGISKFRSIPYLIFPCLVSLLCIITILVYRNTAVNSALQNTYDSLSASASEQAATIKTEFDGYFVLLNSFSETVSPDEVSAPELNSKQIDAMLHASEFSRISVCGIDGQLSLGGQVVDISQNDYFTNAISGQEAVGVYNAPDGLRLVFAVPVKAYDGSVCGAVLGEIYQKEINELIDTDGENSSYSLLCSSNGGVIAGTDEGEFISQADFNGSQSLTQVFSSVSGKSDILTCSVGDDHRYVAYYSMEINDWFLLCVVPESAVSKSVESFLTTTIAVLAVVVISTMLLVMFIFYRETLNRKKLEDDNKEIQLESEHFRLAYDQSPLNIWDFDFKSKTITHTPRSAKVHGCEQTVVGVPESLIEAGNIHADSAQEYLKMYDRLLAGEKSVSGVFRVKNADGSDWWYERISYTNIFGSDGKPYRAVGTSENITEQHKKRLIYESRLREVWQQRGESQMYYEFNLTKNTCEAESGSLFDKISDRLPSCTEMVNYFLEHFTLDEDKQRFIDFVRRERLLELFSNGSDRAELEYRIITASGASCSIKVTVFLACRPSSGDVIAFLIYNNTGSLSDDSSPKKEVTLSRVICDDFFSQVSATLSKTESGFQHAMVVIELDGLERLHSVAEASSGLNLFETTVKALKSMLRSDELIGYCGTDRFVLFLKKVPYDDLMDKRARLICKLVKSVTKNLFPVIGFLGIAIYPRDAASSEALYARASTALSFAKATESNKYLFYQPSMDSGEWTPDDIPSDNGEEEDPNDLPSEIESIILQNKHLIKEQDIAESYRIIMDSRKPVVLSWNLETENISSSDNFADYVLSDTPIPDIFLNSDNDGIHQDDRLLLVKSVRASAQANEPRVEATIRLKKRDGSYEWCRMTAVYILNSEKKLSRAICMFVPVDFVHETSDIQLDALLNYMSGGVVLLEIEGNSNFNVLYLSPSFFTLIGRKPDSGHLSPDELVEMVSKQDRPAFMRAVRRGIKESSVIDHVFRAVSPDGGFLWRHIRAVRIPYDGSEYPVIIGVITDVTQMKEQELRILSEHEKTLYIAEHDSLTGLYNRQAFIDKARSMIASAPPKHYLIATTDINSFKIINDLFGHDEGDKLLCYIAHQMDKAMDSVGGLCCRISADIFALLIPNNPECLEKVAALRDTALSRYPLKFDLGSCTGYCPVNGTGLSINALLDRATIARKSIKGIYGKSDANYSMDMRDELLREQEIVNEMGTALEGGQFEIFLQPQYNHATQRIIGSEALARWRHPTKGLIPPKDFIAIFERNGFITRLDEYILDKVCRLLRKQLDKNREPVPISVNISRVDIYNPQLCKLILDVLERYKIPSSLIRLEITESALSKNAHQVVATLEKLRKHGFRLELDDFGSGYSSLNTLKDVPVDAIKLDMNFLSPNLNDEKQIIIMKNIVAMAYQLGLDVIVEGVETKLQADRLLTLNCEYVQGYYYAKPMPSDEFEKLIANQ